MNKRTKRLPVLIVSMLLSAVILIWFISALGATQKAADGRALSAVKQNVEDAVTMCYAIEGAYPESLSYLKDNYAVTYDADRYIVHYEAAGANIRPTVTVIERGSDS